MSFGNTKTQQDEFEEALKEERQPDCVHCGNPLDRVSETQGIHLVWEWDNKRKQYSKSETDAGWSDKPMCDNCQTKDWDFTNNEWIAY